MAAPEGEDQTPKKDSKPVVNYGLPGNSNKAKSDDKNVQKIVTGEVSTRKKSLGSRIAETFTGDDARSVGQYVLFEVVIPTVKQLMFDAFTQGFERSLFGESSRARGTTINGRASYTPYNRVSKPEPQARTLSQQARATHSFQEIVMQDRGEAELVVDHLAELVSQYGQATVSDFYGLVGVTGSFTDDKWGWTSMAGSRVRRVNGGYLIELPRTTDLS